MFLTDNYALVTGASGGIGQEFALQLAAAGWKLILVGRNQKKLEAVKASLVGKNASAALIIPCDLGKTDAAEFLYSQCKEKGLVVDLLVNNAGRALFGLCMDLKESDLTAMVNLNITSVTNMCSLFGRDMKARKVGRILNVGSFAGLNATPYFASYAATKSYVINYTLALRSEMKDHGVAVTCLLPGYVRTDFDANAGIVSQAYIKFSKANSMSPKDVARVGLNAMNKKKAFKIAGFRNRFAAFFFDILPRTAAPWIMKTFLAGRV